MRSGRTAVTTISGRGSLSAFAVGRRAEWAGITEQCGALLFRGFDLSDAEDFRDCATALTGEILTFPEESSPRSRMADAVFTATDYSQEVPIQFHSEHSYAYEWPLKIVFGCLQPSRSGGRTLLADNRKVLHEIPRDLVATFIRRGILYVRHYSEHRGVRWQDAFGVTDLADLTAMCAQRGITIETAAGGAIQTRQSGPAVRRHPRTGEQVWFNHASVFNVASIEPGWLRDLMKAQPAEALVTQTYFGDGAEISDEIIGQIKGGYHRATLEPFDWVPGDVLLVDNMLLAHAREPYSGDRQVLVAMAGATRGTESDSGTAAAGRGYDAGTQLDNVKGEPG